MTKRLEITASVQEPSGDVRSIACCGQVARTLRALAEAGPRGVTSLEISTWALRTSHYVFILRRRHSLDIETVREQRAGDFPGTHARYVLRSQVRLTAPCVGVT